MTPEQHKVVRQYILDKMNTRTSLMKYLMEQIDLELLRTNPVDWRDIWVYNYFMYDRNNKGGSKLLRKYEDEVMSQDRYAYDIYPENEQKPSE